MGRLEELKKALDKMNPDELREHIRAIRDDRRLVKTMDRAPRAVKKKRADALLTKLKNLPPDQLAALLKGFK